MSGQRGFPAHRSAARGSEQSLPGARAPAQRIAGACLPPSAGRPAIGQGHPGIRRKPGVGALRELREESGIGDAQVQTELGSWDSGFTGQVWSFQLCHAARALPERWTHHAEDGGSHDFTFFWQSLADIPGPDWHPLFQNALAWLRQHSAQLATLVEAVRTDS